MDLNVVIDGRYLGLALSFILITVGGIDYVIQKMAAMYCETPIQSQAKYELSISITWIVVLILEKVSKKLNITPL